MYTIRYADVNDGKVLGEIHANSWKVAYKDIIPEEVLKNITPEKREQYFIKALSEGREATAIIYRDNEPLGFITLGKCRDEDFDSSVGEIWGIYLAPNFFHQGVGSRLLDWGLRELKGKGYRRVSLWVLEENTRARQFYVSRGFHHDGTIKEITIGKVLKEYRYIIESPFTRGS